MDSGFVNRVLFLDLCKAFDTVDHKILIKKLYLYGIQDTSFNWFNSYLYNRKQVCKICNTTSTYRSLNCGAPQGSNLGPLLFLMYINDLPNCLENSVPDSKFKNSVPECSKFCMYADDTNLTTCAQTQYIVEEILNSEQNNIHQWLVTSKLTLNIDKTEYMLIGTRQRLSKCSCEPNISIGGNKLKCLC